MRPIVQRPAEHQVTTAALVMVRLPDAADWIVFRDVLTVNKRPVRDREERLLKLLQSPESSALSQARKIAQESARFNLGSLTRTMNVPEHGARLSPGPQQRAHPLRAATR